VYFGEINWFSRDSERALERLVGTGEIIEALIYIAERDVRFQVVVVEFAQALPCNFGRPVALNKKLGAADVAETCRFPGKAFGFETEQS
jgi:hypothetical protein